MWFGKSKKEQAPAKYPGIPCALDGHAAVWTVETMACDSVLIQSGSDMAELTGPLRNLVPAAGTSAGRQPVVYHVDGLRALAAQASGFAAAGLRTASMMTGLGGIREALYAAAGKRLPGVYNLTCRAIRRQAGSLQGGHDDYYGTAGSGVFQLFAANVQEAVDFSLIAHRVSELSLCPGVVAQDFYQTSQSVQNILLPEEEMVRSFLGRPTDTINAPTPAQATAFGATRRRVPILVDRDHPAGIGGMQDGESYFKALAAQYPFFNAPIEKFIEEAFTEFADLTGRAYSKLARYRVDDAQVVVLAQGAVVETAAAVVDTLRNNGVKAGLIGLTVFRPFPGAELSRLLKGKKAVTVMERTDQPLAEDPPLTREVRSALDKAAENAGTRIHDGYETYARVIDRPRVHTGIYGVGGVLPEARDLRAVFDNMSNTEGSKTRYYLGIGFSASADTVRRFPHLQALQQQLNREYPDINTLALGASEQAAVPADISENTSTIRLYSPSIQGGLFAGNLLAQTLSEDLGKKVRTFPVGGLDPGLQPANHTIVYSDTTEIAGVRPETADVFLLTSYKLLEDLATRANLRQGATMIVGANRKPEVFWNKLSRRTRRWIRELDLHLYLVDISSIAVRSSSQPSFTDQLAVWGLLGSGLRQAPGFGPEDLKNFAGALRTRLERLFGAGHYFVNDIATAVELGAEETTGLLWKSFTDTETAAVEEKEAPWTVGQPDESGNTVFDTARFWRSVGYLYDSGESGNTLTDPYVATGIIPAGSSAYRDMSAYRLGVPTWLPEKCTGCGDCWAQCPDSALPPTVQPIGTIIKTAMSLCEKDGVTMIQMQRVVDHLAKQAYKLFARDDLRLFLTTGPLLQEAFDQLVEKMSLDEDKAKALRSEFDPVCAKVQHYPIARTEKFFDETHRKKKNSGELLSIALNPLSCKGCKICVEVCPEDAFVWTGQTAEYLERARLNWVWHMNLPAVSQEWIAEHVVPGEPETEILRLVDKKAYHSIVGGDGAFPGNSSKTAVHLVTAAIESVVAPRFNKHVGRLAELVEKLENKIQGKVSSAVEINDFDSFGRELNKLGRQKLTPDALSKMAGGSDASRQLDPEQLKRLNNLLSRLKEQKHHYVGNGTDGRARLVMTIDPGGAAFWSGTYPDNPHPQPWMTHLPGDAPALAQGLFEGVMHTLTREIRDCRLAVMELDDTYDPVKHDAELDQLTWRQFTETESQLIPPVLVLGHSGVTSWEEVSRLVSRRYPIKVAVINTEAITLPGTPTDERVSAPQEENDPGILGLARRGAYVMQSTIGHPGHLMHGVIEGLSRPYPAVFHIHAPDAFTHGIAPEKTAEQAKLAYTSRAFPLFEADSGRTGENTRALVSIDGNPDPLEDWSRRQLTILDSVGKDAPPEKSTLEVPVTAADWAIGESRFHDHFTVNNKGHLSDKMKPLDEYIAMDPEKRHTYEPFIHITDDKGKHLVATPSPAMIQAVEERSRFWARLRRLADRNPMPVVEEVVEEASQPQAPDPEVFKAALTDEVLFQKLTEKLQWYSGYSQDPDFFKQSLREFLTQKRESPGSSDTTDEKPAG
jgi:pyruvate-ferredoxin/flavodoxin oxidoreductase